MREAIADLLPVTTKSAEETLELGRALGSVLQRGELVALYGDLGAGKTQLARGICAALGIPEANVHSPTFTIVNEYASNDGPIYHFDAYRVNRVEEFYDLGYEDYFFGGGRCLVEWADRVDELLPPDALRIRLRHAGPDEREISLIV